MKTIPTLLLLTLTITLPAQTLYVGTAYVGSVQSSVATSSLQNNLVAYWTLDETADNRSDSVGGSHLTQNNNVGYVAGKIGNTAFFTSNQLQSLTVTDNDALSLENKSYTITAFVFPLNNGGQTIITKAGSTSNREFAVQRVAQRFRHLYYTNATTSAQAEISTQLNSNAWYFVAAIFDADTRQAIVSVNCNYWNTNTVAGVRTAATTATFAIGRSLVVGTEYFDGYVDEVGVWDRKLTISELEELYNSGNGKRPIP